MFDAATLGQVPLIPDRCDLSKQVHKTSLLLKIWGICFSFFPAKMSRKISSSGEQKLDPGKPTNELKTILLF